MSRVLKYVLYGVGGLFGALILLFLTKVLLRGAFEMDADRPCPCPRPGRRWGPRIKDFFGGLFKRTPPEQPTGTAPEGLTVYDSDGSRGNGTAAVLRRRLDAIR